MPDKTPFVINDRRKFTAEGELRPDVPHTESAPEEPKPQPGAEPTVEAKAPIPFPSPTADTDAAATVAELPDDEQLPPPPTAEQTEQANRAYNATVDRLDTAIRATNPGMERIPDMSYDRLVQSLYMQALLQLGGATEPGQPAQVDILGARQTIDMLSVIADKTSGNLSDEEAKLAQSALFELHAWASSRSLRPSPARPPSKAPPGTPPAPGGPSIVR